MEQNSRTYTILRNIGLAMGIAVAVLSLMQAIDVETANLMLGAGLSCLGISMLQ